MPYLVTGTMNRPKGSAPTAATCNVLLALDLDTGGIITADRKLTLPDFSMEKKVIDFWSTKLSL